MSIVIDSSITISWLLPDEKSSSSQKVLEEVRDAHAWVPSIWPLEIANGLHMAVIAKRINASFRDDSLKDLSLLDVRIDADTNDHAWSDTLRLAERYELTLYDAAYLELAKRRHMPLASFDKELRSAAKKEHVVLRV